MHCNVHISCFGAALAVCGLDRFEEALPVLSWYLAAIFTFTSLQLPIWMMSLMLCNDGNWKEIDIDENHILENIWFNNDLKAPSGIIRFALIVRWLLLVSGQRDTLLPTANNISSFGGKFGYTIDHIILTIDRGPMRSILRDCFSTPYSLGLWTYWDLLGVGLKGFGDRGD